MAANSSPELTAELLSTLPGGTPICFAYVAYRANKDILEEFIAEKINFENIVFDIAREKIFEYILLPQIVEKYEKLHIYQSLCVSNPSHTILFVLKLNLPKDDLIQLIEKAQEDEPSKIAVFSLLAAKILKIMPPKSFRSSSTALTKAFIETQKSSATSPETAAVSPPTPLLKHNTLPAAAEISDPKLDPLRQPIAPPILDLSHR